MFAPISLRERAEAAAKRLDVQLVWATLPVPVIFGDDIIIASRVEPGEAAAALERLCLKSYVGP